MALRKIATDLIVLLIFYAFYYFNRPITKTLHEFPNN